MRARCLAATLLILWSGSTLAHAATSCFPPIVVPRMKIVRVGTDGVLWLADGRAVRLEGILLPAGANDHAPEIFARQAVSELTALAVGRTASIAATTPVRDRYGRIRAQVLALGSGAYWLQLSMLRSGLARVSIAPDRRECAQEFYAAETGARAARLGIWASRAYAVLVPALLSGDQGTFQIVEGKIASVMHRGGRTFFDFGPQDDFDLTISAEDLRNFHAIGVDPYGYEERTIRARGWIERIRGRPEMELATPDNIEVIETQK